MPVDRDLWADSFTNDLPHWRCPTCGKGSYAILDELVVKERGPSVAAHDHEAWEPEWIENRFIGFLECTMPACKELAAISGDSGVDYYPVSFSEYVDDKIYAVKFIHPAPIPINFPERSPEPIVEAIKSASELIWSSSESAANQIRKAVECLMDDVGISSKNASGKTIMLHHRIEEFQKLDAENGDVLLAAKWLGNVGSHIGGISRDNVLDAFDMIEFVLENRYGTTKAELMAKVAAVNAAKGPVTKP